MNDVPDPNAINALFRPGYKPQIVRIALLLDIFSPLAQGPLDAEAVARACHCNQHSALALLNYMVAIGLLRLDDGKYGLTTSAATFLVRGEPAYAGDWILVQTDPELWEHLMVSVRSGEKAESRFHWAQRFPWAQDAWLESYRLERREKSLAMWQAAGIDTDGEDPLSLLDLACGCGMKSMALAQSRAGVQITCVDQAEVLEVARDLAVRLGVLSRVAFKAGDIHEVDLPENAYDAALLGDITDYFTSTQNINLFTRVRKALKPSGVLVIDVPISAGEPSEWESMIALLIGALSGGCAHSFDEYQAWLAEAGFARVERIGDTWIAAGAAPNT